MREKEKILKSANTEAEGNSAKMAAAIMQVYILEVLIDIRDRLDDICVNLERRSY